MKYRAILCFFTAQILLNAIYGSKIDYKSLKLNKLEENSNSNGIKYYKINLENLESDNKDLVIESNIVDNQTHKTPLIVMSLYDFSVDNPESKLFTWVCNQVTEEHCFVPSKYLTKNTVYISTYCNECSYNLKYFFENKTPMELGESKMIHLKSNDKKIFSFKIKSINDFNEYLSFSAFNHKKTSYEMEVIAVSKNKRLSLPVNSDWKEGKQSIFKTSDLGKSSILDFEFVLEITAKEPSFLSVEVGSGNTIINLSDEKFRIDSVSSGTHNCYKYVANSNEKLIAHVKSIEGDLKLHISEENYSIESGKDEVVEFNNKSDKETLVCVESQNASYYTINIFHNKNSGKVKKMNNLLLKLLETDEMYEIPDVHGFKVPIISSYTQRLLQLEEGAALGDEKDVIHITGNGLVGILIIFLVMVPILTVVFCMHDIFVNTKVVDKPILMGKIDS